jgi:cytochrome P450
MEFVDQLAKKCDTIFDVAPWTQFATFDIAMGMIFSNPVGFVKAGRDVNNIIASLHATLTFFGIAGLHPWIARLLYHPWLFPLIGPKPTDKGGPGAFLGFAQKQVASRLDKAMDSTSPDILQWILDHPDKDGQHITKPMLEQESMGVALAASDTTAGTLRAIILAVGSNARILTKLRREIDAADDQGALSTPPTYDQIKQHIPYVEALFKEAQRAYPIVGVPLFRMVPESGAHISGHFFPPGTEVGFSQWAVGHNPHIYGDDVALFRPERWAEDLTHDPAAQRRRDQAEVWFSRGPMMCTGRNVAVVEVYKIVAQFFRIFDVEVVNTTNPWTVKAEVAVVHSDLFVKLTKRDRKAQAEA